MIMNFIRNEDGATAIEYALIAAMISVGIIAAVQLLGDALSGAMLGPTPNPAMGR